MIDDAHIHNSELVLVGESNSLECCEELSAWAEDAAELRYTYDPTLERPTVRLLLEGLSDERCEELIPTKYWGMVDSELEEMINA